MTTPEYSLRRARPTTGFPSARRPTPRCSSDHQADDRPRLVRRRLREAVHRPSDPGPDRHPDAPGSCRSDRGHEKPLRPDGASFAEQGLLPEDYERLRLPRRVDGGPVPITRDEVGVHQKADPGSRVGGRSACSTARGSRSGRWSAYRQHLRELGQPPHLTDHERPSRPGRAAGRGPRRPLARGDPRRRGHQPLVPRDRGEPGLPPAADAHREHRETRRRLPTPGPATTSRRCSRSDRVERHRLQRVDLRDPFAQNLDPSAKPKEIAVFKHAKARSRRTGTTATCRSWSIHRSTGARSSPARPTCQPPRRSCGSA